ncbi:MAG TPA: hypothetical protein IGS40_14875 [Trichormus sp. M33_DOE_039]|nr:hypothetical protein [Trichormus sp. M33_DOE_039]
MKLLIQLELFLASRKKNSLCVFAPTLRERQGRMRDEIIPASTTAKITSPSPHPLKTQPPQPSPFVHLKSPPTHPCTLPRCDRSS